MIRGEDFPDGMSAIMIKEMRQSLRSRSFTLTFACYHILLIALLLISFSAEGMSQAIVWCAALPMLIIPALHAGDAINSEIRRNTLPMLFLTRLTSWRIVSGKWLSASLVGVLFLSSSLPYAVARYFIAKGNFLEDVLSLVLFCLLGAVMAAINLCLGSAHPNFAGRGMPKNPRGGGIVILVLMFLFGSQLIGVLFYGIMRGSSRGFGSGSLDFNFVLAAVISAALIIVLMLSLATAGMAPSSENHARWRRGCVLAAMALCVFSKGFYGLLGLLWGLVFLVDIFAVEGRNPEAVRPLARGWLSDVQALYFGPRIFSSLSFHAVALMCLLLAVKADLPGAPLAAVLGILGVGAFLGFVFRQIAVVPVLVLLVIAWVFTCCCVERDVARMLLWVPIVLAPLGILLHFAYRQHIILLFLLAEFLLFVACVVLRLNPFDGDTHIPSHIFGSLAMIPLAILFCYSGENHRSALASIRPAK